MRNNYDRIARYYDFLSRIVFFRAQLKAQIDQLHFIPANSSVLIVGGGTGWILEEIAKVHPTGLNITYVEISAKMLELSRKRYAGANHVTFVHSPAENLGGDTEDHLNQRTSDDPKENTASSANNETTPVPNKVPATYDVILTAFLFDNFQQEKITKVFNLLDQQLNPNGLWLFSDFYLSAGKKWQSYLLKAMYLFFKQISNVEARQLLNTEHCFRERSYHVLQTRFYYAKFIKALVYQKT